MSLFSQFYLLLWKNFILQRRRPIATAFELLIPIFFSILLILIRNSITMTTISEITTWRSFAVDHLPSYSPDILPKNYTWTLAYAPNNVTKINEIMEKVEMRLNTKSELELACGFDAATLRRALSSETQSASGSNRPPGNSLNISKILDCINRHMDPTGSGESNITRQNVVRMIGIVPNVSLKSFENEDGFLKFVESDTILKGVLAGVIFTGMEQSSDTIPDNLRVTFRFHSDPITVPVSGSTAFSGLRNTWHTTMLYPDFQAPGPRSNKSNTGGLPYYYNEGFLSLLHAVNMAIGLVETNSTQVSSSFHLKRYPYPPYVDDTFIIAIQNTLPLIIMISFFYTSLIIVRSVVHEKESKLKEYMVMMGLANWLHWLAWFVKYFLFLSVSCIVMSALFKVPVSEGSILTSSDMSVVFIFFLCFAAATINLCFLISVFFSKANVGAAAGGVIYALSYMPYLFMADNFSDLSTSDKLAASLLSNVAMAFGWNLVGLFEGKGTGVQWNNFAEGVTVDSEFSLLHVCVMLLVDAVLYMLIALYVEGVWPGDYGIPKPWHFPITRTYWFGPKAVTSQYNLVKNIDVEENGAIPGNPQEKEFFEADPAELHPTVKINGLRKVYKVNGKEKVAVNNLHLNMYDGQITVLLGHNGAGKTTTMSMLTGFFPPTSGDATINGHSITDDIKSVRKSMGLCPQFNILFDQLTVDEHIYFFARLKGLDKKEALVEVKEAKESLKLVEKGSAQSRTLSGGMKRKLSVGIALCAGSKYIILDEPTSGMDPAARRAIWDVLQHYRRKCSMLLSTHFMDEADLLGDRIAIMAEGNLRCAGSPVFLKNKFGVGYHIVLTKSENCDLVQLGNLMQSHVSESLLERISGAEVSFVLPFHASPHFSSLFKDLDMQATTLGISGYGAIVTTMEEVFLRVTEDGTTAMHSVSNKIRDSRASVRRNRAESGAYIHSAPDTTQIINGDGGQGSVRESLNTGLILWFQQFYALLVKKMLHSRRNYKVAIAQALVPVFFAVLAILSVKYPPFQRNNVPFDLGLDAYGPNTVYVDNPSSMSLGNAYQDQFKGSLTTSSVYKRGEFETFLADEYTRQGGDFNTDHMVSASFNTTDNSSHVTAWFNNQAFHTPATSLAYIDQAYLRYVTKRNFSFSYINYPLPRNSTNRIKQQLLGSLSGFFVGFYVVMGFSFLSASFCIFLVRERVDRSSLLQALAGVEPFCFWISAFVWDFINFLIPCFLTIMMFFIFTVSEFSDHTDVTLLLFALYCLSSLPLMYLLSFMFTTPSTALVRVTLFNVITGTASVITINVLRILDLGNVADQLNWFFLLMPPYCLGMGLADVYVNDKMLKACTENTLTEKACEALNITYQGDFLAWEAYGVGKFAAFLAIQAVIFFTLLFLVQFHLHRVLRYIPAFSKNVISVGASDEHVDDDVVKEAERIEQSGSTRLKSSDQLLLANLCKVYGRAGNSLTAVQNLSVGIPKGECFGLLGINGAGKTTTFKMLTGDLQPTAGTAYLDGYDVTKQLRQAQQRMGYCPQFDGLIEQMTGAETLRMFARLRGVKESSIPACIKELGSTLHFSTHLDKECGKYSGGNKRKLSTAIALVGDPPVVLLDEPSTGMDPGARRMLWDALTSVRTSGRSIVITSHSMEECEALCTRLAIMVNGTLRCLGGPQHLKNKFGQGYTAEIKANGTAVKEVMKTHFPESVLKDEHNDVLTYNIPEVNEDQTHLNLSTVFDLMEKAKTQAQFGNYTVTQTTLEQVFLRLVRRQREAFD